MPGGKSQQLTGWEGFDYSETVATALAQTHYWDATVHPYWSMFVEHALPDEQLAIEIFASNDWYEPVLASRTYMDVTNDIYGGGIIVTNAAPVIIIVDTRIVVCSYKIVFTPSDDMTWTAQGRKSA